MSFYAGPRMRRSLGLEASREEAPKVILRMCALTEVLESCCKMECSGAGKKWCKLFLFAVYYDVTAIWSPRNLPALLTILEPLGRQDESTLPDHTCALMVAKGVSEGLDHLHPGRLQASVSYIHMDTCWMLHLNFLYMKIPLSLVIYVGDSTQPPSSLRV